MNKTKRNQSIELLRIVAIMMVILHHIVKWLFYDTKGVFSSISDSPMLFYFASMVKQFAGMSGNVMFAMMSGYFMLERKNNLKKIGKIAISFYGMILYSGVLVLGLYSGCRLLNLLPVTDAFNLKKLFYLQEFWYFRAYIVFLLVYPLFMKHVINMSKQSFAALIIIVYMVFETLKLPSEIFVVNQEVRYIILGFLMGGFLAKFDIFSATSKIKMFILALTPPAIFAGLISFYKYAEHGKGNYNDYSYLYVLLAFILFGLFKKFNFKSPAIGKIATVTGFVYVFHIAAKPYVVGASQILYSHYQNSGNALLFIAELLVLTIALFVAGTVLGWCYQPIANGVKRVYSGFFGIDFSEEEGLTR
jgi:surface polysaccharide O-acyltransferase-like enzyme